MTERPLTDDEAQELREAADALEIADAAGLGALLQSVADGELEPDEELQFHLGAWWGREVARITGWTWVALSVAEGLEAPAVVSPDRGVAALPLQVAAAVIEGELDDEVLITVLARLRKGDRPSGEPGTYALMV